MSCPWPGHADEAAGAGESDKCGFEAGATETDVGAEGIGQGDEFHEAASGRHDRDAEWCQGLGRDVPHVDGDGVGS